MARDQAITDTDRTTLALNAPLVVGTNTFKVKVTAPDTTTMKTYMVTVTLAPAIVTNGVEVTSTPMATGDTYGRGRDHRNHGHLRQRGHGGHVRRHAHAPDCVPPRRGSQVGRVQPRFGGQHGPGVHLYGAGRRHGCQRHLACGGEVELFRGTIRAAADTTVDASLTYAEPGLQSGHKVDGSPTTTDEDDGTDDDDATLSSLR